MAESVQKLREALASLDAFDKSNMEELKVVDRGSSMISMMFTIISLFLVITNIFGGFRPNITRELNIDTSVVDKQDLVNISIAILLKTPCYYLHFDSLDSLGFQQLNLNNTVSYRRLSSRNEPLGFAKTTIKDICHPCFGMKPEGSCCNSCERMKLLYKSNGLEPTPDQWPQCSPPPVRPGERCLIKGKFSVNQVPGSFHIAPGKNIENTTYHAHDLDFGFPTYDLSHQIRAIRFGPRIISTSNPLVQKMLLQDPTIPFMYRFNLMVTPVVLVRDGKVLQKGFEYQALVTRRPVLSLVESYPGLYFHYSFTPYTVRVNTGRFSLAQFIVSICGFLSGVFAIASIIDIVYTSKNTKPDN